MATVPESPATTSARRSTDYWIFLGAAIIASIVLRLIVNTKFQAPTILTDELTYSQLARDIADGKFSLSNGYGVVYPLLLAPSWVFNQFGTEAYTWMKATNAVLVSLTAIPVFFWARRMMQPRYALLAAVLTLLMPSMAYSGHIMTENAFLLFFMLAAWSISVAVERPTIVHQVLVVVAILAAFATRAQAIVLLAALPLIIVLHVLSEERAGDSFSLTGCGRRLFRFWPLAAIAGLGALAIVVRTLATDWHVSQLLQAYSATTGGQYTVENVSRYFLWHLGEATFALGVIPVAALLLLVGMWILNRTRSSAERAYLATAVVTIPLVILQVAIFTSWFSQRVSERNMFCVFPIVLIGLALWFDIKLPRPTRATALAAAIAGVLVLSVPFAFLYQRAPSTETWAIVLPELLSRKLPGGVDDVQLLIAVGIAVSLILFGIARRAAAVFVIPLAVLAYFAVSQFVIVHEVGKTSANYRAVAGVGTDASWIDHVTPSGQRVSLILGTPLGPDTDRLILWQMSFFNRTPLDVSTWSTDLQVAPATGVVTAPDGRQPNINDMVITPTSHVFEGETVADHGAFIMQRPQTPYALQILTSGIFTDGWTASDGWIDVFESPAPGAPLNVTVDRIFAGLPQPGTVKFTVGSIAVGGDGSTTLGPPQSSVGLAAPSGTASTQIDQASAPYRIAFTASPPIDPTTLGVADPRKLGSRLTILIGPKNVAR